MKFQLGLGLLVGFWGERFLSRSQLINLGLGVGVGVGLGVSLGVIFFF